jgi:hypothetical protein
MIGIRAGLRAGAGLGLAAGLSGDAGIANPLTGVSRDATSNIYMPATVAQWNTLLGVAGTSGAPFAIGLCQEASGNLATVGGFTFTASGTGLTYQNAVAGWSALAVGSTDAGTGKFANADVGLPDLLTTSCAVLSLTNITTTPGTFRNLHTMGTTTQTRTFAKKRTRTATVRRRQQQHVVRRQSDGLDSPIHHHP